MKNGLILFKLLMWKYGVIISETKVILIWIHLLLNIHISGDDFFLINNLKSVFILFSFIKSTVLCHIYFNLRWLYNSSCTGSKNVDFAPLIEMSPLILILTLCPKNRKKIQQSNN